MSINLLASSDGLVGSINVGAVEAFKFKPNAGSMEFSHGGSSTPFMAVSATGVVSFPLGGVREILTTNRTYYVRTDGSDSNNGLANTSGGAFLTIQKAIDVAYTLDTNKFTVTIQVADGTYTGANSASGAVVGAGSIVIQGNVTTPGNVVISVTGGVCFSASNFAYISIKGMKLTTTTSGWALAITGNSIFNIDRIQYGACVGGHAYLDTGSTLTASGDFEINGSAPIHIQAGGASVLFWNRAVTLTGTPGFSTAFIVAASAASVFWGGGSFIGSATGKRYDVTLNSVLNSSGGGTSYFPGNVAGTTATGGQYA